MMDLGIFLLLYFIFFLNGGCDSLNWFYALEAGKRGFRLVNPPPKFGKPYEDQAAEFNSQMSQN